MGLFGPSREERLAGAARALAPYGFAQDPARAKQLERYQPFVVLTQPEDHVTAFFGSIEGAPVEAYEYGYSSMDNEGHTNHFSALAVAIHHPWVNGGAAFSPDRKAWGGVAAALGTLRWLPPFTLFKALEHVERSKHPDRVVGHSEFDRLYYVRAESDESARRAIPPRLREVCVRSGFRGRVELRPGVLLYSPAASAFDERTAVDALGIGAAFVGALAPESGHPMR